MVFFDQNTLAGDWRAQVRYCRQNGIALYRDIAFAAAVADLLELPDDLPLMPAVTAAIFVPTCLNDRASLAHLKAVARAAGTYHDDSAPALDCVRAVLAELEL